MPAMRRQVQRGPFVDTSTGIQVKALEFIRQNHCLVQLNDCLNALVLTFAHGSMEGSPVVVVFLIHFGAVNDQHFSDNGANPRIF